ncbi:efflux RND transporter periplasmic adaptor subunit [Phaeobacter gallaeciensis]|uniref:Secretion protein, HylD family n=1 Tax=Phaeobacter gallaeciensis TaxID=60890 RepID=A0AAC9ZDC6_9RHOB|nr:efflux RND transporter periplasmic adaptor subunit [Phaeobacter gallaeciensis]AHD11935.1 RND family efflux transporter, MFP subunit [Phaeobacter gallaeciensis DSM 26640]ATE95201.1 putative secretion protein, HylD family [Phaeobacter gallaeciensis]ATE99592.1 putative secretion protein, HylD family [Phaeobacter gallaeciensis]ATF03906.1 putative secretion protein, HylD family [Phaeobacter gallaeciensis]ATF08182.1 putative secretion protein, HylD family [Phaeobacter gallaeciensis]
MATPLHANQQGRAEGARGDTASPAGSAVAVPPVSAVNETSPTSQAAETRAPTVPPAAPDPQVIRPATATVAQPASAPQPPGCAGGADSAGLEFVSDPEAKWPPRLAAMICAGLVIWMAAGLVWPAAPVASGGNAKTPAIEPVSVAVRLSQAAPVTRMLRAEGVSKPDRDATLRAEMSGHVASVAVAKGARVEAGQLLANLQPAQRTASLARAEASLLRAERDHTRAAALHQRGSTTEQRLSEAREALAVAKADLAAARQGLAETRITAPFAGHLEAFDLTPGAYVQEGAAVARVVALDPLRVSFQVPQHQRGALRAGALAQVRFLNGNSAEGRLSFLGQSAQADTRSFAAEVVLDNPSSSNAPPIPAGISARIAVPLDVVQAHFLSPALLSLDMAGVLGIKSVDDTDRVVFTPVEIVQSERDGVWVSGLPDQLRLITVGQGFVTAGEEVRPRDAGETKGQVAGAEERR